MIAFRSVVIPVKAAVMNLLSVGAAYGVVTLVFQEGHGVGLVGLPHAIPIVSFAPLLMFAILFGLSMDYEVFLVSQIQERYHATGDAGGAVVEGLAATGRVITSAALVMVFVFSSFLLNGDPVVKEFGIGLAVAIALDATVVRCMLVPSVMELLGERSWWLPGWLDRILPHVNVEGTGVFDDAPVQAAPPPRRLRLRLRHPRLRRRLRSPNPRRSPRWTRRLLRTRHRRHPSPSRRLPDRPRRIHATVEAMSSEAPAGLQGTLANQGATPDDDGPK